MAGEQDTESTAEAVLAAVEVAANDIGVLADSLAKARNRIRQIEGDLTAARARISELEALRCGLPASIQEALNSGDGTYRP